MRAPSIVAWRQAMYQNQASAALAKGCPAASRRDADLKGDSDDTAALAQPQMRSKSGDHIPDDDHAGLYDSVPNAG
jgi:hypothetical protein